MLSTFNYLFASSLIHYDKFFIELNRFFQLRLAYSYVNTESLANYFDVVVVGGGIVGSATARQLLLNRPGLRMAILEKENELGIHQTGHNSGVIHAGIYYKPGSLKAKLCVEGSRLAYEYCDEKKIPYKRVGKLIVACDPLEVERLNELYDRSIKNQVQGVELLQSIEQIQAIEPKCVGLAAIWSPNTGIVDWGQVNRSYGKDFKDNGGTIFTKFQVTKFELKTKSSDVESGDYPIMITSKNGQQIHSKYVITAAGLYADKIAQLTNGKKIPKIVPFRGEYLVLRKESSDMVKTNIYPVPDPRFPFLGVHFTPRMDGSIWVGPNAVLAFKREGYRYRDFNLMEFMETATFSGFLRLSFRYFFAGIDEMYRSLSVNAQLKKLQRFVPTITKDDLDLSKHVAGVRAQALDADGNLVDDFVFEFDKNSGRVMHVRNAPSPAATSSLAIARVIAERAQQEFKL
ncbi:l-2-hydroxyglutarate dehydrogenase [Dermatophagoides farinae]|uniref:L-2-hydroxyglutarate dehydrogenase, mitochondrial n=1 Tax=Dermatophagoides farinae TaxID=6954 RepID=A0A9D4SCT1_DERFA|nr:L-2-hydroxyglutarate dehydrogenase, mitochondrial-like [Dermatophagoides farinae]KAH7637359.1 l-2-hydroxyglutarate dehydrogenase [Dermatophagoides farinae]